MGQCGKNSGFQAGTWQESRASMPRAKQGEECPLRTKLGYLSTQTWDRGFGGLWLPVGINKFVDNTIMVRHSRQIGRSPTTLEANVLHTHAQETSNRANCCRFNDKKRKNDTNKENEMELIVTYGVEV
jgi:hypothetical protein